MRTRLPWALLILLVAIVTVALLEPWEPTPDVADGDAGHARGSDGGSMTSGPSLATHGAQRATLPTDEDVAKLAPDVWTLEIAEVVGPGGRPVRGAVVYIDQARTVNRTWTWSGDPVRIHMRPWADDAARREENEREGYVVCDDTPVYVSVRHERYATWFAPAFRYGEREKTVLRAVLGVRRSLSGTVLAHDGNRAPVSDVEVIVRPAHVPEDLAGMTAYVDREGHFRFDDDDVIPAGPLRITARSEEAFIDGLPVTAELGPRDEESVLVLEPAHKFRFFVRIDDSAPGARGVWRSVALEPPPGAADASFAASGFFEVGTEAEHKPYMDVLLPEGGSEVWRLHADGYRAADVELRAMGEGREHDVVVRLEPAVESGLLAIGFVAPAAAVGGRVDLQFAAHGSLAVDCARWTLRRPARTPVAVRLPSGVRREVRLFTGPSGRHRWILSPFELALRIGQRVEREIAILDAAVLRVARVRKGGFMPDLRVRLTQGRVERRLSRWIDSRDTDGKRAYVCLGELEPGPWTIELLQGGKLLSWSKRVQLRSGESLEIHIPDDVVLPDGD